MQNMLIYNNHLQHFHPIFTGMQEMSNKTMESREELENNADTHTSHQMAITF